MRSQIAVIFEGPVRGKTGAYLSPYATPEAVAAAVKDEQWKTQEAVEKAVRVLWNSRVGLVT